MDKHPKNIEFRKKVAQVTCRRIIENLQKNEKTRTLKSLSIKNLINEAARERGIDFEFNF